MLSVNSRKLMGFTTLTRHLGPLKFTGPTLSRRCTPPARASGSPDTSITTSNLQKPQSQSKLAKHETPTKPVKIVRRPKSPVGKATPIPPEKSCVGIYVAVYEADARAKADPEVGFTREFMRHSSVVVQPYPHINQFFQHHVTGKPLEPLTYECISGRDPRESMRNLSFDFVGWIPRPRVWDLEPLFQKIKPRRFQLVKGQPAKSWNSQMFVQDCLQKMAAAGLISKDELKSAIQMQQRALNTPWTGHYPNLDALAQEHSDKFIP